MSSPAMRAVAPVRAFDEARAHSIRRELERFRPEIRPAAAALARRHPRLADLALSFPALLAALAWPNGRFDARAATLAVVAGAPLEQAAALARVPLWLRKLAPAMIVAPIPDLPDGEAVRRRIVNHLPSHSIYAAQWFEAVAFAHRWAHEDFALWCAREFAGRLEPRPKNRRLRRPPRPYARERLPLLCLWAWYSNRKHFASRMIVSPWTTDIRMKSAMSAVANWWGELDVELALGCRKIADPWFEQRHYLGYEFVPISMGAELIAEAIAMQNCVRSYAVDLAEDERRLFSVRKDDARVATLSIGWSGDDPFPEIDQLLAAANERVPAELWWIAHQWMCSQDLKRLARDDFTWKPKPMRRDGWEEMWKPYWLAKGRAPDWLPFTPSREVFNRL